MKIAIYSRKSKFTGKGESIENQIEMCTDYAKAHFQDTQFFIYEDEGFSGSNTDRPEFKRLLKDIKERKVDVLMCYRLDRISRNVADFSSTLEILEKYNVSFVSIKEQFDTSSPMGRAMTYISSVFAQLERETIAERIRDNMLQLAKTGRWLGGVPPIGFISQEVATTDEDGKIRKQFKLIPVEEEMQFVEFTFDKFLELGSLMKLESFLIKNDIKTRRGKYYGVSSLKLILTNPVYLTADSICYEYLKSKNYQVFLDKSEFDGTNGIMPYNRTYQANNTNVKRRDRSEWIISIGAHKPVIPSKKWIKVQTIMDINKDKSFRKIHSQEALLPGLLRCSHCGSYMRPKRSRLSSDGTKYHYYYICELKEKSNSSKCNVNNIPGHTVDAAIIKRLKQLSTNKSALFDKFNIDKLNITDIENNTIKNIDDIKLKIKNNEDTINVLLSTLGETKESIASKYIINQINTLGEEIKTLEERVNMLEEKKNRNMVSHINISMMQEILNNFSSVIDNATIIQKRNLVKNIIEQATWDGDSLMIDVFGGKSLGEH